MIITCSSFQTALGLKKGIENTGLVSAHGTPSLKWITNDQRYVLLLA